MPISCARRSLTLKVWSLSTFHATGFLVIVTLAVHLYGALADTLRQLETATGFAAFIVLWVTTCAATSWGLRYAARPAQLNDALSWSIGIAGGLNGVLIFAVLLAVFAIRVATASSYPLAMLPVLFFGAIIGCLVAFTIGTTVGLVFGILDTMLIRMGSALCEWIKETDVATP